jgi:hypothetical protein
MLVLHLGVIDQPYTNAKYTLEKPSAATTGQVAVWLENKYHIWTHFWEIYGAPDNSPIQAAMLDSLSKTIRTLMVSRQAPRNLNPFGTATGQIEFLFKQMLDQKELDRLGYPGIPTLQALKGYSNRFKRRRGPPRPSFIDTGLMQASMKAWLEG